MKTLLLILVCASCMTAFCADDAAKKRMQERRGEVNELLPAMKTYVDKEGWQTGTGYRQMQQYVKRLAILCENNLKGLIVGIAGGKRGILLRATPKAKINLLKAKENTKEFLTAIVNDLAQFSEPVAPVVYVTIKGDVVAQAELRGERVIVKFSD